MDPGRSVVQYQLAGKLYVRTIGASWKGDSDNPEANTRMPVLVVDSSCETPQHLRPEEAERLMGMPAGCTAGPNITAKQRLSCIGNGWDLNVVKMFWDHYRLELLSRSRSRSSLASVPCSGDLSSDQQLQQCAIMGMLSQMPSVDFAAMLSNHSLSRQQNMLGLMKHWHGVHPVLMASANTSVLDSGSSRHLQSGAIVLDADTTVSIEGFDGSIK